MDLSSSTSSSSAPAREALYLARRLLGFALITALCLGIINWRLGSAYVDTVQIDFERVVSTVARDDGIILGSSHIKVGFDPRVLANDELRVYNHAFLGASPRYNYDWYVNYYRANRPAPRFVILGVSGQMFDPEGLSRRKIHDLQFYSFGSFVESLFEEGESRLSLIQFRIPLLKYRTDYGRLTGAKSGRRETSQGHLAIDGTVDTNRAEKFMVNESPDLVEDFTALLELLIAEGAKVVLVSPPIHTPVIEYVDGAEPTIRRLAGERGITFIDYNGEFHSDFNLQGENFADRDHLSALGSERYSERVRADLNAWLQENHLIDSD